MRVVRPREAADLRVALEAPAPSITILYGPDGAARSAAVRRGTRGLETVRYRAAPLPDPDHRALLVERLGPWREAPLDAASGGRSADALTHDADWDGIFDHLAARAGERRSVLRLVLEEFGALTAARPRLLAEVERFWAQVRGKGLPVHLVLTGDDGPSLSAFRQEGGALAGWVSREIPVLPLTYREVGALLPGYPPRERLLAWSVFGGASRHLAHVDPEVSLATNIRQAVLSPESPLLLEGVDRLERSVQSVSRYATLLRSLAAGQQDWSGIVGMTPEFSSGGQMAPYLARLQELGLVRAETSLDAAPGSRARRYRMADPFLAFWFRFVLPRLTDLFDGRSAEVWRYHIRRHLDDHAAELFPFACRQYLAHHVKERLGVNAREVGGLWGQGYDVDVAGTLRSGAAVYAFARWSGGALPVGADQALLESVRKTRYGFGREARLRLLFSGDGFTPPLIRRAAILEGITLIDLDGMFGTQPTRKGPAPQP